MGLRTASYIFFGGALGAMLRYLIWESSQLNFTNEAAQLIAMFTVNISGAFALGVISRHPRFFDPNCRALWGTGFAGGFTTLSAVTLFLDLSPELAPFIALMLLAGVMAFGLGYRYGRRAAKLAQSAE